MGNFHSLLYLCLMLLSLSVRGAGAAPAKDAAETTTTRARAALSPPGKKRAQENLLVLAENLKVLEANLDASQKNIAVVDQELKDLEALESEHEALESKYATYIRKARDEVKKGDSEAAKLQKWRAQQAALPEDQRVRDVAERMEKAEAELQDRKQWKTDAEAKLARVEELLRSVKANLRDIRSRKGPLQDQRRTWGQRVEEYRRQLSHTQQQRADLEAMLR